MSRVLIIEDEKHISEGLKLNLELIGHEPIVAENGVKGLELWKEFSPELIVLDLMLPELDGVSVLDTIRKSDEKLPILILSAKDQIKDKLKCFTKGVDDYLTKPFNLDEFLLRVKRLLERSSWSSDLGTPSFDEDTYSFGKVKVDFLRTLATVDGEEIKLTMQELKLLKLLFASPNVPLKREYLLEQAWGYTEQISTRTLDNFMVRFRKYFETDPKSPQHFISVRSVGYQFNP